MNCYLCEQEIECLYIDMYTLDQFEVDGFCHNCNFILKTINETKLLEIFDQNIILKITANNIAKLFINSGCVKDFSFSSNKNLCEIFLQIRKNEVFI